MTTQEQEEIARIIAINLCKIMKKKGFTSEAIYNQTNISRNTISYIKTGNKGYNASVYTLYKIAKCLKCDIRDFFETQLNNTNIDYSIELVECRKKITFLQNQIDLYKNKLNDILKIIKQ